QELVNRYLREGERLQAAGDLQGALARISFGLAAIPDEPQLRLAKGALDTLVREQEEWKRRQQEEAERREQERKRREQAERQAAEQRKREEEQRKQQEAERLRKEEAERQAAEH